jgi:hypothetical protein
MPAIKDKMMDNKKGGTLVVVMMVMTALTIISIGLFKVAERNAIEAVHQTQSAQAFWVVESGLQHTLEKIYTDEYYRDAVSTDKDYPDQEGPYTVEIDDAGQTGEYTVEELYRDGINNRDYHITVRGTVAGMSRRLYIVAAGVRKNLSYGIMVLDGQARIKQDSQINGSLYTWGDLNLFSGVTVSDSIHAKTISDGHDYIKLFQATSVTLDGSSFYSELDLAAAFPGGNINSDINLNDYVNNTLYVNGNANIPKKITGPGKLVIDGNLKFTKNYSVDDDVEIIVNGDVNAKKNGSYGTNVTLFATGKADFDKATMGESGASSVLILGDINVEKEIDFSGLIYSEGNINLKKTADVSGSIISGGNFDMDKDAVVTYDASLIPAWLLDMLVVDRYTSDNTWNELPSL